MNRSKTLPFYRHIPSDSVKSRRDILNNLLSLHRNPANSDPLAIASLHLQPCRAEELPGLLGPSRARQINQHWLLALLLVIERIAQQRGQAGGDLSVDEKQIAGSGEGGEGLTGGVESANVGEGEDRRGRAQGLVLDLWLVSEDANGGEDGVREREEEGAGATVVGVGFEGDDEIDEVVGGERRVVEVPFEE